MWGMRLRALCAQAAKAIPRQWDCFLLARSPLKRSTDLVLMTGVMRCTPSSVAFSTNQSMRSLAGMATIK